mmetsp:Transcript_34435/g.82201  ORF Transcript_34435/g.82201 Transcript_34435/m.82201 type:complete len:156 (-) Transcript_34435:27-494(-)
MASEGKSEGKAEGKSEGDGKYDDSVPTIDVSRLSAEPSIAPVTAPLTLEIDFSCSAAVRAAVWQVKYMVDSVGKRKIIVLGETGAEDYAEGEHSMAFAVDSIDVSGIKPSALANAGLLIASLRDGDGTEIIDINLVVQVSKTDEGFERCIFNPLE